MTSRSLFTALVFVAAAPLGACGGNVATTTSTTTTSHGGDGGGGGASTSSSSGGASTSSSSGGTGGAIIIGTGGAGNCGAFDVITCLSAYPSCVPVYEDTCCPTCDPGPCADCANFQFHHCAPHEEGCAPGGPPCGVVPEWACSGGKATCDIDPAGSPDLCATVAGCIPGFCNLDSDCTTDPVCVPVTAESCGPSLCNALPPPCPDGTTNEIKDGCFTWFCISNSLCKPTL